MSTIYREILDWAYAKRLDVHWASNDACLQCVIEDYDIWIDVYQWKGRSDDGAVTVKAWYEGKILARKIVTMKDYWDFQSEYSKLHNQMVDDIWGA